MLLHCLHTQTTGPDSNAPSTNHGRAQHSGTASDWIMEYGATHHITNDLDHLHLSHPYHGTDQLIVRDGFDLPITHTGKIVLSTKTHKLHLPKVLHVPTISQNLLSV